MKEVRSITDEGNDDRLMARAALGDTAAFDRIVRQHQDQVQRFAIRMLGGDSSRGSDVAVGTFLRLWESRESYQPCGRLRGWLLTTAYRLCLDACAHDSRETGLGDVDLAYEPVFPVDLALRDAIREAVTALPATQRAVLVLAVYEELSYEAIAEILSIPAGTVASRKNHAVSLLRRRLAGWEESR